MTTLSMSVFTHRIEGWARNLPFCQKKRKKRKWGLYLFPVFVLFRGREALFCVIAHFVLSGSPTNTFPFCDFTPLHTCNTPQKPEVPPLLQAQATSTWVLNWISLSLAFAFKAYKTFSSNLKTIGGYILSRSFKTLNYVGL